VSFWQNSTILNDQDQKDDFAMRKSRFTEEQIVFALQHAEYGAPVKDVISKMGISEQTFYRWK